MSNQLLLHVVVPEAGLRQILEQVMVDNLELAGEHTASVNVAGVRLDGFIVAHNLSRRGRGHRGQQQAVADAMPVMQERAPTISLTPTPYFLFYQL